MCATKQVFAVLLAILVHAAVAQPRPRAPLIDPLAAANVGEHRWFPYRPVDPAPSNPANLVGVQITDDGIMLLTFDQDLTANCYAGNGLTVQPENGPKRRVWFKAPIEEVTEGSLKMMLATALTALHGGGQLHVLFNFANTPGGQCCGRYVALTKPSVAARTQ